jgi:hypothetical protein
MFLDQVTRLINKDSIPFLSMELFIATLYKYHCMINTVGDKQDMALGSQEWQGSSEVLYSSHKVLQYVTPTVKFWSTLKLL